jgi:EAL domain-containing protein (putative c-di-GMP-specific phosphodiesterase class I)
MLKSFGINGGQGYFLHRPNPDYRRAERARTAPVAGKLRFG